MAKVYVVDDAAADLAFAKGILAEAGHEVVTCANPLEAEQGIVSSRPDAILLDIVMPERSGYEILRKLKKDPDLKRIPVALVSTKTEPSDLVWGKSQGAAEYLPKPYSASELLAVLGRLLEVGKPR